jgi:hypothetical protein
MEPLTAALVAYALTAFFAMAIACTIPALGFAIKKLRLEREDPLDLSVPTSNSMKEEELLAVAIAAAARAARRR